ncbi:MAG: L,D-transpeptidase family protein [Candidatus Binatia bacterium]
MKPVRPFLCAAILAALCLTSGPAAAELWPPSTVVETDPDGDSRWAGRGRAFSEQASRLEEALERYREIERRGGWNKVPTDVAMGPESFYDCSRIAALEQRLIAEGYLRSGSTPPPPPRVTVPPPKPRRGEPPRPPPRPASCQYGRALTEAMKAFQADRRVLGIGQLGSQTMAQLNRPVEEIVNILERDVGRWRYVSLSPSGTYLLVNIPFYELIAYERGREGIRVPVIVGQKSWQTPLFSDELEYIVVNPDWGIPDSIAKQEIWPLAKRDPNYLRRQGITATGGSLRQKPGPNNPLGRIKFVMPNEHNVYLHDTPGQRAFTAAVRALSHGCIRLAKPIDLANYLLHDDPQWNPRRLQAAIASGKTQQINLREHVPVHIVYSTSRVNDEGRVELRPDVYEMNKRPAREAQRAPSDESLEAWP